MDNHITSLADTQLNAVELRPCEYFGYSRSILPRDILIKWIKSEILELKEVSELFNLVSSDKTESTKRFSLTYNPSYAFSHSMYHLATEADKEDEQARDLLDLKYELADVCNLLFALYLNSSLVSFYRSGNKFIDRDGYIIHDHHINLPYSKSFLRHFDELMSGEQLVSLGGIPLGKITSNKEMEYISKLYNCLGGLECMDLKVNSKGGPKRFFPWFELKNCLSYDPYVRFDWVIPALDSYRSLKRKFPKLVSTLDKVRAECNICKDITNWKVIDYVIDCEVPSDDRIRRHMYHLVGYCLECGFNRNIYTIL